MEGDNDYEHIDFVPEHCTGYQQVLDVGVNFPFKNNLRKKRALN